MNPLFTLLVSVLLVPAAAGAAPAVRQVTKGEAVSTGDLEAGFRNPPSAARPQVYWAWMNGNITREGLTADLEAMARAGVGGALIFNLAGPHHLCDIPAGPADYLGPAWLDLMKHAASEAGRLGLELGMQNCAGWATTGGPWIKPELAMQKLVSSEVTVEGGRRVDLKLPQPETNLEYYRDIAVFAIPASLDSGFRVDQWEPKAGQRGGRAGRQPDLKPLPQNAAIPLTAIIDVSRHLGKDGTLVWDAAPGSWKILRLGHTPTGMTNKPAPASATGLEIDKLRREGLDVHWRHGIQPVLDHLGPLAGKSFDKILIDSYEAGLHHWTPRMREEFQQRRGYDPSPYLLALTGRAIGDGPTTDRFLWDFRRTISDLFADNYYGYMAELCHAHGLRFTTEPYTSCFEGLQVGGKADIPMAEFWANGGYSFSMRLAASLAHTHGRPVAAAEAFTAGPEIGRWTNYPGTLKRAGDLAWSNGINRLVIHRYTHQPWPDLVPGMTMGQYGIHFERTNTWWEPGRAWLQYIARSQFLLQSGEFGADVLCFAGNAAPNGAVTRNDLTAAGFGYDACGSDILAALTVDRGDVVLPCGKRYRLLVLPDHPFHTPAFARKLRELVRAGATILGPKPLHTPSLAGLPASEEEVRAIGEEVWGNCDGHTAPSNRFGAGRVFAGLPPAAVLAELAVAPAVTLPPDGPALAWLHRHATGADIFFVANQSPTTFGAVVGFRAAGRKPELWDAEQGTIRPAPGWTVAGDHVRVPLDLRPGKSVFVVFRHPGTPEPDPYVRAEGPAGEKPEFRLARFATGNDGNARLRAWTDGPHTLHHASGKTGQIEVAGLPEPLELSGPWTLRFQPNRGAPAGTRLEKLIPWNEHPEPGIRHFSGTATYSIGFALPPDFLTDEREVWLDLGEVAVMAEVRLNRQNLGILWHRPFRVEVGKALRPGTNTLEVDVTNLWVNRLIGDEQLPDDREWTGPFLTRWPDWLGSGRARPATGRVAFTTWKHWSASDPLLPSGLLGPVALRPARLVPLP
jgi:hypothetical protein